MRTPLAASAAVTSLLLAALAAPTGCSSADDTGAPAAESSATSSSAGTGAGGSGGSSATVGAGGTGGEAPPEPTYVKTVSGDMTWQVTFDDVAKAAGATDCAYTRHYEGVEDRSAPWLCPSCEVMFRADVAMTAGQADCYTQVTDTDPATSEWVGYGNGTWWRGLGGPMTEQGMAVIEGSDVTTTNNVPGVELTAGGTLSFDVAGQLSLGEQEGDPMNGWATPATYACGWPKSDAAPYDGDYALAKDAVLPDGLFHDVCDETVRLHDFKGTYLVVDMSAMDCPPCQSMAHDEEQFVADMAAQGVEVSVVTLLAPSLSDTTGLTTKTKLNTWITKYHLESAVLADRAWGLSVFGPVFGDALGYPAYVIVRPDLTVLDMQTGYGGFDLVQEAILADAQ